MTTFDNMPAAPLDQPAIDVADLQAKIVVLENQLEDARGRATTHAKNHVRDVDLIGEMLMKEANERGWCDQYDNFVDTLNRDLRHPLPTRYADYQATITVVVNFSARPHEPDTVAEDIGRAIYHHADNLGGLEYEIDRYEIDGVNEV